MKTYSEKLKDPRWQKKRLEVMQRDGFKCRMCGDSDATLHVHHCHYEKGNPWDADSSLLMTLCSECHKERQNVEDTGRRWLGVLFAQREYGHTEIVESLERLSKEGPERVGFLVSDTQWLETKDSAFLCGKRSHMALNG